VRAALRARVIRVVADDHRTDVEELLQIGRRRRVVGLRQRLAADRMVAAIGAGHGMPERQLLRHRSREERVGLAPQPLHDAVGHAVAGDGEEADLATRPIDRAGHLPALGGATVARRREVDDGNRGHSVENTEPPSTMSV